MDFLIIIIAVVVVIGGAALAYFLVKKYLSKDEAPKAKPEKAAAPDKAADNKKAAAAEKRRAEMMKKIEIAADPKVLEHRLVKKAVDEITKAPRTLDRIEVKANRIDWYVKEDCTENQSGNVFFDDLALHRLEQGEMKLVAEHIHGLVKNTGFEISEEGSGEKGTFRYHVDKYIIKAL
ncbi:MAG: hypothetical protein IJY73_07230 [Oscillospiraceae bacterium]|nr:hypothetical protein [Oscillospiraceae bacterium]